MGSNEISITIKTSNAEKNIVVIDKSATVAQLKLAINDVMKVLPENQRLIYKGRVLKDDLTLENYGSMANMAK